MVVNVPGPNTEPFALDVAAAASAIRGGGLSAVELMESLLSRAERLEPKLQVWVTLDEERALADARASDEALAAAGPTGPMHGVPVGVKDIYYTAGMKTTACSPIFADSVPDFDAATVARLRQAGAIIMGKTVTTEFACMDPSPTRNPWNVEHTPGGSSSGSAAGVSARIFPAAMGSQTAGSVLRPASYNGVVGMKPTFGRISRYGVMPVAWSLDTMGFFSRTVEDAGILLDVLAGHDSRDPASSDTDVANYGSAARHATSPRVGVVGGLFHERADAETRGHFDAVIERLSRAGAEVENAELDADFEALLAAHRIVMSVEAASVHESDFATRADDYGPKVRGLIEAGMITPAVAYVKAQRVRHRFRVAVEATTDRYDVLATPSTPAPAPRDLSSTGDPVFQTPWTTCGLPALTLPTGLSESGLPLGLQLASAPFAETTLLSAARWCEEALGVGLTPPGVL